MTEDSRVERERNQPDKEKKVWGNEKIFKRRIWLMF